MADIHFTSRLRSLVPHELMRVPGANVGEALDRLFAELPQLRSYVLDDQGRLRHHVCVFADGIRLTGEDALRHAIAPDCELYVMQALSGG
jgi:hypothetical protein